MDALDVTKRAIKTCLAAKSVALVNAELLRTEYSVILWLVPSNTIREQTLRALRDREHPYHGALRDAGPITVLSLDDATSVTRATLESSTTVIVSNVQAFRRENTDGLKVFESNGALMSNFEHLDHAQIAQLQRDEHGAVVCSLANVLRLRRPFLIVDEAHNSRTALSFSTFAGFRLAWDRKAGTLTITAPLTDAETEAVQAAVAESKAKHAIEVAAAKSRAAVEVFQTPAERGEMLVVPQMALRIQGELQLFDDPEVLEYPWELSPYDAVPTEFACACKLDTWAQAGRMQFCVRNLVRKEGCAFFLQKAGGRFYPDFLCKLNDGAILIVEHKGADRWNNAQDDRDIGELWAALSGGRCKFVMVCNKQCEVIEALL